MSVRAALREQDQIMLGLLFGSAAFLTWGLQPIYFKAIAGVPALEMLALRVAWAAAFMLLTVIVAERWTEQRRVLGDARIYSILAATASLIATNWLVFIWAIANAHVVQCSLGLPHESPCFPPASRDAFTIIAGLPGKFYVTCYKHSHDR
jgi:chloramphenicol-sensitive protein RarD